MLTPTLVFDRLPPPGLTAGDGTRSHPPQQDHTVLKHGKLQCPLLSQQTSYQRLPAHPQVRRCQPGGQVTAAAVTRGTTTLSS